MNDPCKSARCICYPICITKTNVQCPDFLKYILEYINYNIVSPTELYKRDPKKLTYDERRKIWDHATKIFPKLLVIEARYIRNGKDIDMNIKNCRDLSQLHLTYITIPP